MQRVGRINKLSLKKLLKGIDIFAKPIQLTYRGKEKFRSTFGGVLSLVLLLFLVSIFVLDFRDMILRNKTQNKKNTLVNISNSYTPPEVISDQNISFAFKLSNYYD